jgi:hypothetical protein
LTALDEWVDRVGGALDLGPTDTALVLDLARDVAHGVMRPAAPVTAYLLGLAVGRGADPQQAVSVITGLVREWRPEPEPGYGSSTRAPGAAEESAVPASPEPPD